MEDNESLNKRAELQFLIKNKSYFYLKTLILFLQIIFLYKTNIILTYM